MMRVKDEVGQWIDEHADEMLRTRRSKRSLSSETFQRIPSHVLNAVKEEQALAYLDKRWDGKLKSLRAIGDAVVNGQGTLVDLPHVLTTYVNGEDEFGVIATAYASARDYYIHAKASALNRRHVDIADNRTQDYADIMRAIGIPEDSDMPMPQVDRLVRDARSAVKP